MKARLAPFTFAAMLVVPTFSYPNTVLPQRLQPATAHRPFPEDLDVEGCSAHFDKIVSRHGVRHPSEAFERRLAAAETTSYRTLSPDGTVGVPCEAVAFASGGTLRVHLPGTKGTPPNSSALIAERLTHRARLDRLHALVRALPSSVSFVAGLLTTDNGGCDALMAGAPQRVLSVVESMPPWEATRAPLLVPKLTTPQDALKTIRGVTLARRPYEAGPCRWRGTDTGYERLQAASNANRTLCNDEWTDRECVVALSRAVTLAGLLDASFVKPAPAPVRAGISLANLEVEAIQDDAPRTAPGCSLAVDGNAEAGFAHDMLRGDLVVRLGGYDAHALAHESRASTYEWWEPLLVDGVHYVRTTVDHVEQTLRQRAGGAGASKGVAAAQMNGGGDDAAIARRGRAAMLDLMNATSVRCYALLASDEFARREPAALAHARAHPEAFVELEHDDRRGTRVSVSRHPSRRDWVSMTVADGEGAVRQLVQTERGAAASGAAHRWRAWSIGTP